MFRKFTLFSFLLIFLCIEGYAQERHVCGTSSASIQQIQERLLANKEIIRLKGRTAHQRSQDDVFIPLRFHLIANDIGRNRVSASRVFDQMCTLNETFRDLNLQFYIKDFNLVNSQRIFDNPTRLTVESEMDDIRDPNAVNIFVVGDAQNPNSERPGNTLGYYSSRSQSQGIQTDWIVIEREQLRDGGMTLPHELGHFFSLPHPFNGWDQVSYDPNQHGSPVQDVSPGGIANEFADGSNCESAGDMICDTPAEYLTIMDNNCGYRIPLIDPKGDTLNPDPTLIMGYFLDRCVNRFTPMQTELMIVDYNTPERDYLRGVDNAGLVRGENITDDPMVLVAPRNGSTVSITDQVRFEWQAVEGAQYYGVEVFSFSNPIAFVETTNTSVSIPLEVGSEYRWKVRPYNDTYFCAPDSELRSFATDLASAVPQIQAVEAWTIQPNPLTKAQNLNLSLSATASFEASIRITNLAGQVVQSVQNIPFQSGTNHQSIDTRNLLAGVYIVALENKEGVVHQKLVIQ